MNIDKTKSQKENFKGFKFPLKGDIDALYMSNYVLAADYLARRINSEICLELCCAVGATTIIMAQKMKKIFAIDNNQTRIKNAYLNAKKGNVLKKIEFIVGDVMDDHILKRYKGEIKWVMADPDWSPPKANVRTHAHKLKDTTPPADLLYNKIKKLLTSDIVFRLPISISIDEISSLDPSEIQHVYIKNDLKFFYLYFGKLKRENGITKLWL
ncbi:MAG: hypothetical protein DRP55_07845 [Spirochaetes bacterium]|nr:hypothetical protein [Deltaproteobacteria bacterium]RKX99031.1 MAG: hypothetical protein DRP55_07845 [Spirochaetota bacterium]RLA89385.1 MAG: hypothetical protein DRG20_04755 [Deltaproteobacteria bacterium]